MCVVSAITEPFDGKDWPRRIEPWLPSMPEHIPMEKIVRQYKTKSRFDEWNFDECLAYIELLEKAIKFDEISGEPNCSDPEKTKNLSNLRDRIVQIGLENSRISLDALKLVGRLDDILEKIK